TKPRDQVHRIHGDPSDSCNDRSPLGRVIQHGICRPAEPQRQGTTLRAVHTGCVERSDSNQAQGYAICREASSRTSIRANYELSTSSATPAAVRPARSSLCRFFHLIDVLIDFLYLRMHFFKNFSIFPGELFDSLHCLLYI